MADQSVIMAQWFARLPGALLIEHERAQLTQLLAPILGKYLVQIGGPHDLSAASSVRHKFYLSPHVDPEAIPVDLNELPLLPQSVDVALLVHALEFHPQPQVLLAELHQSLVPGGQLIIVGFNPWSLWGRARSFGQERDQWPWCGQFWSSWQVKRWLRAVGYRVISSDTLCFRPPVLTQPWVQRLLWMEAAGQLCLPGLGGAFLLRAQKRVIGMTPLEESWWSKKAPVANGFEPTTRTKL